jgi:predicted ATPase
MKIKKIELRNFKRFTDLTVQNIPPSAKLVIMAGPNGCGKSSLFEGLNSWHRNAMKGMGNWDETYHPKQLGQRRISWQDAVKVEFHDPQPGTQDDNRKAIYVRSAYRNDPEFQVGRLNKTTSALEENRLVRLIENDATVGKNYERMASQGLEDVYESEDPNLTIGEFREKTIGEIRNSFSRLFPELSLNGLGNPLTSGTFKFDKGASKAFLYKNLSGGEKAAFDLLLDLIVKKREFDNTIFCIDEPEAHMNTRLQGALLEELYTLLPETSQLWLATHSIGMMRRARDLANAHPDQVVFLDFENQDFDQTQIIEPIKPTRAFWHRVLNVALDDLAELVAPSRVVICEGKPLGAGSGNVALDATCYEIIFGDEFPDTRFLSSGNSHAVESDKLALIEAIRALVGGTSVMRLIDRDDHSPADIAEKLKQGVRVLSRRHLESYLYDDEVLTALCEKCGAPQLAASLLKEKAAAVAASVARGNAADDVKSASGEIYNKTRSMLGLTSCGNNAKAFMRSTLAPLLNPGMKTYQELRKDIFKT